MMNKFLLLFLLSTNLWAGHSELLEVHVHLWPAGDFVATSTVIRGKVYKNGPKYMAKNIRIPVISLDTGIELRNHHLQLRLNPDNSPGTNLLLVEATGKDGKGSATIKVNGLIQKVLFTFEEISSKFIKAKFKINFSKFKIPDLKYMGIGVKDVAMVTIIIPLRVKK